MNEEAIFHAALAKPAEERAGFLEEACAGDAALRRRVDVLLEAHANPGSFLRQAAAKLPSTVDVPAEYVGMVIAGRYKLLEQIGEGGMGTVWVAEQTQPVRRKVALKLIKAGMDSKTVLSRFEAERQALALMDHPNIAKVLDGSTTGQISDLRLQNADLKSEISNLQSAIPPGRPFFVMEYVKGIPLTKYCDNERLSIAERLALFVPVCNAIQHAHQKGIIHRDLKPSNILVCLYDGQPVPKVIDFGLAKAIHQPLTEHTLHTAHGVMMGTPLYMSPEQAEFNNLDVDTRTDIYALGVILYELLTGSTPLERQRFKEAAWLEMLRLIKEQEPPKPSDRLSGSGSLPSLAAQRKLEPAKLTKLVRGELDWIVMKALEKERSRRYETANGFARDIQRYLADEPVEACPPSAGYRLRKFARKYRTALTTGAVILVLLVAGVAVSTWQAIRATQAESDARAAEGQAAKDRDKAKKQEAEAVKQANIAKDNEKLATEAVNAKDSALRDLTYNSALDQVRLSQTAFENGNVAEARHHLEQVPSELRRWEWHYLKRQYDAGIFTLYGHKAPVLSVAFSPDGTLLASGSDDKTAKIWDAAIGTLLLDLKGHTQRVGCVAFSPDGAFLATASDDGAARVWNVRTGATVLELKGHDDKVNSVAYSADGTRLVTGSNDMTAKVWDARTGMPLLEAKSPFLLKRLPSKKLFQVLSVAFSHDGTRIAAGFAYGRAEVFDARTGAAILEVEGRSAEVTSVAFSPDGARLLIRTGATAEIFDVGTGTRLLEIRGTHMTWSAAAFSPDATKFVSGGIVDRTPKVWDARTGTPLLELKGHSGPVEGLAFSPDGTRLATGSHDHTVKIWDAQTGTPRLEFHTSTYGVALSPDGIRLATAGHDQSAPSPIAKTWDTRTGASVSEFRGHTLDVNSVAFSPDGARLATGSIDTTTKVWDTRTAKPLLHLKGHTAPVKMVTFSPDGTRLATTSSDQTAKIWDARTGALLLDLARYSSEEMRAATAALKLTDVFSQLAGRARSSTATSLERRAILGAELAKVAFSPDSKRLLVGAFDQKAKVWTAKVLDVITGAPVLELRGHTSWVVGVAFSPDGMRIATGSDDQTAKLWDARTGSLLREFKGHTDRVESVAFSPDGTRLFTASWDGSVKVWDVRTGTPVLELKGRGGALNHMLCSADGKRMIAAGLGPAIVWDVAGHATIPGDPLSLEEREYRLLWTRPPGPDFHWREYRSAQRVKDEFAASFHLSHLFADYHQAIGLAPRDAQAHLELATVLQEKKDAEGALDEYRRAVNIDPTLVRAHLQLAKILEEKKDEGGALDEYRKLVELDPTLVQAHKKLVVALAANGDLEGTIAASRRILSLEPQGATFAMLLASLMKKKWFVAGANLGTEAFLSHPYLAQPILYQNRYNAACCAALAAAGKAEDAEKLANGEPARWRKQAIDWLRADLAAFETILASPQQPTVPAKTLIARLVHWQRDIDLVSIRDTDATKLPADEREACRKLWADVETLLKKLNDKTKGPAN